MALTLHWQDEILCHLTPEMTGFRLRLLRASISQ